MFKKDLQLKQNLRVHQTDKEKWDWYLKCVKVATLKTLNFCMLQPYKKR